MTHEPPQRPDRSAVDSDAPTQAMAVVPAHSAARPQSKQAARQTPDQPSPPRRRRWPWIAGISVVVVVLLAAVVMATGFGRGFRDGFQAGLKPTTTAPQTADQIVRTLTAKVPDAKPSLVFTAENDPNHLLGRPNGYTSKASFTDSRITGDDLIGSTPGDVGSGGSVEVFPDADTATTRQQYISSLQKAAPILGTEYDYISGSALVRISGKLTPAQAGEYKAALGL